LRHCVDCVCCVVVGQEELPHPARASRSSSPVVRDRPTPHIHKPCAVCAIPAPP
jgi:hypothetical protein